MREIAATQTSVAAGRNRPLRMAGRIHHAAPSTVVLFGAVLLLLTLGPDCRWYPPCPFHELTGLYCPLCGSTRALHAMLHGHLLLPLRCNALIVISVLWVASRHGYRFLTGRAAGRVSVIGLRLAAAAVVVFALARNLPVHATWWLRP